MSEKPRKKVAEAPGEELVASDDAAIGRAFRRSTVAILVVAILVSTAVYLLRDRAAAPPVVAEVPVQGPEVAEPSGATAPEVRFTNIAAAAGIDFSHVNGAYGDKLLPETMGGGIAFLDYDGDGDQDLLFVNSAYWPWQVPPGAALPTPALYRNDGTGRFANVTAGSGLDFSLYGTGVAVGDYDGDGRVDLFVTAVGENLLLRNLGGRFADVTGRAGVAGDPREWSTSAAFFDYDNDGDLDLFVANYVGWSREIDFEVDYRLTGIGRAYGPPDAFTGRHPYLYRNDGNGTFTDVSAASGVQIENPATGEPMAKALGVMPVDLDGDGWMDLFVANDTVRNFLYHNLGNGRFEERGVELGVAFDRNGAATGAMGVDAAHFRNDADLGIAVGNFANEMTSLYVTQGRADQLADEAIGTGIGPPSRLALSFGLLFLDYDLDGRLDLLQANGHLEDEINLVQPSQHHRQPAQLFWNCGTGCRSDFVEVPGDKLGDLTTPVVGRGASYADIDGDGDLDLAIAQIGGPPLLLRNDQATGHRWLRVVLEGTAPNRDAIGAVVEVTANGIAQKRTVMPSRGYLSQVELPLTFGLGSATQVDSVRVVWPGGASTQVAHPDLDRTLRLRQPVTDLSVRGTQAGRSDE